MLDSARRHRHRKLTSALVRTWTPRRLFPLGTEQGGVYYPDDPNSLLRRRNRLTYSSQFDNAAWVRTNILSVTANADGVGDLVVPNTTATVSHLVSQSSVIAVGAPGVLRVRAKPGGYNWIMMSAPGGNVWFNVSTGVVGSNASGLTVSITAAADAPGYYDCTAAGVATATGTAVYVTNADTVASFTADGTSGVYLARAQLEWNTTTASTYQEVTDWNTEYMAAVGHLVTQFQDSAGTTTVQKVGDPVGLTLDRRFGLMRGPELAAIGNYGTAVGFDNTTTATSASSFTITGGTTVSRSYLNITTAAGTTYEVRYTLASISTGTIQAFARNASAGAGSSIATGASVSSGATQFVFTATNTTSSVMWVSSATGALSASITGVSVRAIPGNHRIQATSGSRKTLSARYNQLIVTQDFSSASWQVFGAGVTKIGAAPVAAPNGSTAYEFDMGSAGGGASSAGAVYQTTSHAAGSWRWAVYVRAKTGTTSIRLGATSTAPVVTAATADVTISDSAWTLLVLDYTSAVVGSNVSIRNNVAGNSGRVYIAMADLRTADDAAKNIPAYQRVNTASDYDTDGFYHANVFDGTDDNDTCATGGGNTSGLMLVSAITVQGGAGTNRVIWSDIGTNTGWRVRINTSNQLEISAGNGSAYTTIATTATLPVGETHVISAWEDGANLCVQIDNGTVASTAKPTISAGTTGFTIGKENGAASGYFFGRIYDVVARWSGYNPTEHARLKTWAARLAGMTL